MSDTSNSQNRAAAAEAYTFFFPMLMGYRYGYASFLNPALPSYDGPVNQMLGEAVTLNPEFREVISPNADTPYSMAMLDLRAEPLVLSVPEVADRYYVMQFVDLFGTNAHYVGSRTTGSAAGHYLLAGPQWSGAAGDQYDGVLRFETDLVFLIGRTQLKGGNDIDRLAEVMAAYRLQPMSSFADTAKAPAAPEVNWLPWNDDASRDERFIAYANFLLPFCQPVHPDEVDLMTRMAAIGIGPGRSFDAGELDPDTRQAIRAGVEDARQAIGDEATNLGEKVNGWTSTAVFGDRAFYAGDYLLRAAAAMAGWGGNDADEAVYPMAREDGTGAPLDGANSYQVHLTSLPPVRAFWSLTMYDTSYDGVAGYLVDNPIDRYLINTNTEGLQLEDDGSLIIHIQHDRPEDARNFANWLPAPDGPYYVVFRMYWPDAAAKDGSWALPPVERVG